MEAKTVKILKPEFPRFEEVVEKVGLHDIPIGDPRRFEVMVDMIKTIRRIPWYRRINWKAWRERR
ncbi:MAG: hypothetical protein E3J81_08450 [Dehalococcoidia bacterium]|nr:MAG: hypothetical protein E3J81_08450 [Dehalococcoidia bacterium]